MTTTTQYTTKLESLTPLEVEVLRSAYESSEGNGHDFGYTDEINVEGKTKQAVGGAITSLLKKDVLCRDDEYGQFCFGTDFDDDRYTCAEMVATKLNIA